MNIIAFTFNNLKKVFIILFIATILVLVCSNNGKANAKTSNIKNFKCITITEDDTLWSIANENMSSEYSSVDEYIEEVISINNLSSSKIYSGATLVIPYYVSAQ